MLLYRTPKERSFPGPFRQVQSIFYRILVCNPHYILLDDRAGIQLRSHIMARSTDNSSLSRWNAA